MVQSCSEEKAKQVTYCKNLAENAISPRGYWMDNPEQAVP